MSAPISATMLEPLNDAHSRQRHPIAQRPPPLGPIRSLAYFRPVIDEVLHSTAGPIYYDYLRRRLPRYLAAPRPR